MKPAPRRDGLFKEASFIDGEWVSAEETIEVFDPATLRVLGRIPNFGAAEALIAVTAAHLALPSWRLRSAAERSTCLRRWGELMRENDAELARLLTAEQGKPLAESLGEVAYAASFLEWFAEEARRVDGEILAPHHTDKRLLVSKQPVGVVAAITPWNFPLAMITRKAGPALASGCTMVLKPSELTPFSALALAALSQQAGIPPGVFNVVTGDANSIGKIFTGDDRVRKLSFTGSTSIGKLLAARCMASVKRVSLELGGNAPFIVFEDADLDAAVEGAVASKFRNTGQTCICANRFLVQEEVYDEFAARLVARVSALKVGNGLAGPTDQGPLIDARAITKVIEHVEDAVQRGAHVLTGGQPINSDGSGHFFAPTVIVGVAPSSLLCREETFGPVAGLVRFTTEAEAIRIANDTNAGLAAYVYTTDLSRSWRMSEALEYGMIGLNTGVISTEVAPFGGIKESGLGREGSRRGIDEYLDIKLVCASIA